MSQAASSRVGLWLRHWTEAVLHHAPWVVAAYVVLIFSSGYLALTRLGINTDTSAMLSPELPWRRAESAYLKAFPRAEHRIIAVVESDHGEARMRASRELLQFAQGKPEYFTEAQMPFAGEFFDRHGWLYLSLEQLDALALGLEAAQPFIGRLSSDPSLASLFELLGEAISAAPSAMPVELAKILEQIADNIRSDIDQTLSWQALIGIEDIAQEKHALVLFQPRSAEVEREAVEKLRDHALSMSKAHSLRIRFTGEAPLWVDQLDVAAEGASVSAVLAMLFGAAVLYWGLRSLRLVPICVSCLIAGLVLTAGFATLSVGRLNMISVAFATLYIGVAIDYGVQFCTRYQELMTQGVRTSFDALSQTAGSLGYALLLCALTSSAAFLAFVPTDYAGISELGWISGGGILIGLLISLSLLPALIHLYPPKLKQAGQGPQWLTAIATLGTRRPRTTLQIALVLALLSAALASQLQFDHNPTHLNSGRSESVRAYQQLAHGEQTTLSAYALVESDKEALEISRELEALETVKHVISLARLIPQQQEEKLEVLDSLNITMALSTPSALQAIDLVRTRRAIKQFNQRAKNYQGKQTTKKALQDMLGATVPLEQANQRQLASIRDRLLGELPALLIKLSLALSAEAVRIDSLPDSLRHQWQNPDGQQRLQIVPRHNLDDNAELLRFVAQITTLTPQASGAPVSFVGGARSVKQAFAQAFAMATLFIVVLLALLLRNLADVLRALLPLALGTLLLLGAMVLMKISMNFANVIALPLILGIGVDIGILMLWRARQGGPDDIQNPVFSTTGHAVFIAVMATLGSFASLIFCEDGGMSSIGQLLTLGLLIHLLTTFLVLPALLKTTASANRAKV